MSPLTLKKVNFVYCFKASCGKILSYIGKTKRHLTVKVQVHLSGKSGISAIHEHISSCKDCHSCTISNFYIISQANTDFEAKIKEALCIKKYAPKLNNQIYHCFFIFVKIFF